MRKMLPAMLAIALAGCAQTGPQPQAQAQATESVAVLLTGEQESPPVQTAAAGQALIVVDEDGQVSGVVTAPTLPEAIVAIVDDTPAAPDAVVPVVLLTPVAPGRWEVPANTRLTGAQMEHYKAGHLAANVRTRAHPNGELRGRLQGRTRSQAMGNR